MAKSDLVIEKIGKKPYSELWCPFQSTPNIPVYCEADCALIVLRFDKVSGKTVFVGCGLKWLALCADKV